ncbi:type II toxin-antitoxin system HipA family toxin, partial [Psychroserpens sp.]|uniref:type II toxin-antitoxin system HipA family toxin n=2 Tax=Psychroserpens sp. TaxID=2020870 RepID=UPI003C7758C4
MARDKIIDIITFGQEIGKLGYDLDQGKSFFQYNPEFLDSGKYSKLFPFIFKRTKPVQVFTEYQQDTFQGLPPMIADSLPDTFGNIIFQEWLTAKGIQKITPLEQLTYVSNRGMGALVYKPIKELPESSEINIDNIISILEKVLKLKEDTTGEDLSELSLLNVFKIGSSAGGARPKILISEHKDKGSIIAGDRETSDEYNHYLVKLHLDDSDGYNKEKVEYAYYLLAQEAGIVMMPSKLINNKHFATLRYDRQHGEKQHVLTVTGLTGWDFKSQPENSSYENVFKVALGLEVPHKDLQQLFKRMMFNLIFRNVD